jgi:hypothetical protein
MKPNKALLTTQDTSGGTPAPGSNVRGGLEVDGTCILNNVTISGGLTVDGTGAVELNSSTVNGGLAVSPGGELDINATTNGAGNPTGASSTINGNVTLTSPVDFDIWTAQINGGLSVTGTNPDQPFVCSNNINGDVVFSNYSSAAATFVGDPEQIQGGMACAGNTIHGSLSITNSHGNPLEVESNSLTGSVALSGSTLQFNGNTVGGSLSCSGGTTILPPEGGDTSGNTVGGSNTC